MKGKKRAEEALKRYVGVVRIAEVERDDMRDAVMKLVEKGVLLFSLSIFLKGIMLMWFGVLSASFE